MRQHRNPSVRSSSPSPRHIAAAAIAALSLASAGSAAAARVSGTFVNYQGQPIASRDLHFDHCVTHDSYLAPTHGDGTFAQSLPPGCYDLRAERGAIVRRAIVVGEADVAIGQVSDLAPLAPARLFQLQTLFPTLLTSPAPSTAYILTRDATVVPVSAAVVPVPSSQSEWLRLRKQTEAAASTGAAGNAPAAGASDFNEPMDFRAAPPSDPLARPAP